ncbi:hypothetical protein DCAR_0520169 [Daucus carota subsp. sativus]|uniref:25S rRNA (uridine-N(3))-methyltransferase BMT5-like domain-containing protein n=1 Tax=Daucus carota subsp. sativus TaxID=79200 RepID=A0A164YDE7_DAUCS|nr:PREDICTED: uncharacterized protein LOC108220376 [Daucus carota subsp. sativus]WOH00794.1 hypothetical protein DCAR_0520169 [Daucus carota subsp. sativus]
MAEEEKLKAKQVDEQTGNEEQEQVNELEEKWVKYYSSLHEILLVGEGDFSFSACLAQSFGSASNIVASSLDSFDDVIKKYKNGDSNLSILEKLGASHLHEVDATKMKFHSDLKMRKFDRIIFNFPHAGFYGKEDNRHLIGMHKKLLNGFFRNASGMLRPNGEIHVNHKISDPYCHWNLEELASDNSLRLIECVAFKKEDYPGYENKRVSGLKCDDKFLLGECSTFKFSFSPNAKQNMKRLQKPADSPKFVPQRPNSFMFRHRPSDLVAYASGTPAWNITLGRIPELLQTLVHASHQQGNILQHGQRHGLLQNPACAYQQENYQANRHPSSDLVTFVTKNPALNIPYGRSYLPLQAPTSASQQQNFIEHVLPRELRASQQGNIREHVLPHELRQTLIRASQQGNIQAREFLQASLCSNQQPHYPTSRCPPSDINLQMSSIQGSNGSLHVDLIFSKCKSIFGGYFEQVVKALGSPDHSSKFLEEAFQLGYKRYMAGDPRGSPGNYKYILEQLRKFVGRESCLVSRPVAVENNRASNSRFGPFM